LVERVERAADAREGQMRPTQQSGKEGDNLNPEDVELGRDVSGEDTPREVGDCEADG